MENAEVFLEFTYIHAAFIDPPPMPDFCGIFFFILISNFLFLIIFFFYRNFKSFKIVLFLGIPFENFHVK